MPGTGTPRRPGNSLMRKTSHQYNHHPAANAFYEGFVGQFDLLRGYVMQVWDWLWE